MDSYFTPPLEFIVKEDVKIDFSRLLCSNIFYNPIEDCFSALLEDGNICLCQKQEPSSSYCFYKCEKKHEDPCVCFSWSRVDWSLMASCSQGGKICIWIKRKCSDFYELIFVKVFSLEGTRVCTSIDFSAKDRNVLAVLDSMGFIGVWDWSSSKILNLFPFGTDHCFDRRIKGIVKFNT